MYLLIGLLCIYLSMVIIVSESKGITAFDSIKLIHQKFVSLLESETPVQIFTLGDIEILRDTINDYNKIPKENVRYNQTAFNGIPCTYLEILLDDERNKDTVIDLIRQKTELLVADKGIYTDRIDVSLVPFKEQIQAVRVIIATNEKENVCFDKFISEKQKLIERNAIRQHSPVIDVELEKDMSDYGGGTHDGNRI